MHPSIAGFSGVVKDEMSFGYQRLGRAFLGDSKILDAYLFQSDGQTPVAKGNIHEVKFTVRKPSDDPNIPSIDAQPGVIVGEGAGQFVVPGTTNNEEGEYRAFAQFTYDEDALVNLVATVPIFYDIIDAFERTGPSNIDPAVDAAWLKLEDCFDSEFGGPWLRDQTFRVFDKTKMRSLAPETLLMINETMPYTDHTLDNYPYEEGSANALFAQGLLVSTIRHLMRSYTEQPEPVSSPVAYMSRLKYQQAWKAIYDIEVALFDKWLYLWKLRSYNITTGAVLIGTKAGRMLPAPMRSRNVGRGF